MSVSRQFHMEVLRTYLKPQRFPSSVLPHVLSTHLRINPVNLCRTKTCNFSCLHNKPSLSNIFYINHITQPNTINAQALLEIFRSAEGTFLLCINKKLIYHILNSNECIIIINITDYSTLS